MKFRFSIIILSTLFVLGIGVVTVVNFTDNAADASTVCQPGIDMQNINYTGVDDLRDDKTEPLGGARDPEKVIKYSVSQCPDGGGIKIDSVGDYPLTITK